MQPSLLNTPLPADFPAKLESPLVWEGKDFTKGEQEWVYALSGDELKEVDDALKHFKCQSLCQDQSF